MSEPEVLQPTALEAIVGAEVDKQIATAKKYPRNIQTAVENAKAMVTSSPDVTEECHYALPRAGKDIEGPSVRLAEILAGCWGNLRVASRVTEIGDRFVTCESACHDLENNLAVVAEVKRRITGKNGRRYNDDMIMTTSNAGCSIAFRNAVFKVVPKALWNRVYQEALLAMKRTPIPERRTRALSWFAARDKDEKAVVALLKPLGVKKVSDIEDEALRVLTGVRNAILEGTTSVEEVFSPDFDVKTLSIDDLDIPDEAPPAADDIAELRKQCEDVGVVWQETDNAEQLRIRLDEAAHGAAG